MNKSLIIGTVVVVALGAGQFYSASKFSQEFGKLNAELKQQGFIVTENNDTGVFGSRYETNITLPAAWLPDDVSESPIVVKQKVSVTHLPWGARFSGTLDMQVAGEEDSKKLFFSDVLDTDPVLIAGRYNPFSGGSATMTFAKFAKQGTDGTGEKYAFNMPEPTVVHFSYNPDFSVLDTESTLANLNFDINSELTGAIENLQLSAHQDHMWPEDEWMDSSTLVTVGKAHLAGKVVGEVSDFKFNVIANVGKDGKAFYQNQISMPKLAFVGEANESIDANGTLDLSISGIYLPPLRTLAQKWQALSPADANAYDAFFKDNQEAMLSAALDVWKQSTPKIEVTELDFKSSQADIRALKGKGYATLKTADIDPLEVMQSSNPFVFLENLDKLDLEFDVEGQVKNLLPGPYGDKLKIRSKDGKFTINDQELF